MSNPYMINVENVKTGGDVWINHMTGEVAPPTLAVVMRILQSHGWFLHRQTGDIGHPLNVYIWIIEFKGAFRQGGENKNICLSNIDERDFIRAVMFNPKFHNWFQEWFDAGSMYLPQADGQALFCPQHLRHADLQPPIG